MLVHRKSKEKKEPGPIERTIALKEKLIGRLKKEITEEREASAERVKGIEFRIKIAQTLVDALKK